MYNCTYFESILYKICIHACNPAGVASSSGNMTVVFTLGSLLGVAVLQSLCLKSFVCVPVAESRKLKATIRVYFIQCKLRMVAMVS